MQLEELYNTYLKHPSVTTDSRAITEGCLFFALKGARFNGNAFAANALAQGAAYAIVDEEEFATDERCILVEDVLKTLQDLAAFHRQRFYIPILAITGSNGKTTTKELLNAVLSSHYPTHCTQGNYNNHIGVPLTLLAMPQSAEIAIVEMGANHQREIDFLCRIADPTHGLITNIGKAHLEGFGGIEGVKKGKSELYRYLQAKNGMVFVNLDEPFLDELSAANAVKLTYLQSNDLDPTHLPYEVKCNRTEPYVNASFLDEQKEVMEVNSQLIGKYNFNNIMTAISVGRYFKVPSQKIKVAIEQYQPQNNRSQVIEKGGNTYILDAYNANPTSIHYALQNFKAIEATKKVAILGDMLELGEYSRQEHQTIYEEALAGDFDYLVLVGKEFGALTVTEKTLQFADVNAVKDWWDGVGMQGAHILVKGSRGIRLEQLLR